MISARKFSESGTLIDFPEPSQKEAVRIETLSLLVVVVFLIIIRCMVGRKEESLSVPYNTKISATRITCGC